MQTALVYLWHRGRGILGMVEGAATAKVVIFAQEWIFK